MNPLEKSIPGLPELRASEHRNRALAFAGITHRVCGVEINPITPRTRLELQMVTNAFTRGDLEPRQGDVSEFLWIHSPARIPLTGLWRPLSLFRQEMLRRRLKGRAHDDNVREIREYLVEQMQDMPGRGVDSNSVDHSPWVHWVSTDADFWISIHGGFTLEAYLDTPMLILQQLYRAWCINNPEIITGSDGKVTALPPTFVNASDRLYSSFLRTYRAAAAEEIKKQRFRLAN